MKRCKRAASLLLAVILCIMTFSTSVSAVAAHRVTVHTRVNPLYTDTTTNLLLQAPRVAVAQEYGSTMVEAAVRLRAALEKRESNITITVRDVTTQQYGNNLADTIFNIALLHTGVPTQGDYLMWHYRSYRVSMDESIRFGTHYVSITYHMTYLSSAQQERAMDAAVDDLLSQLDVWDATDYEKVRAIYDYICENVVYDQYRLDRNEDLVYTAYAALIENRAVCQGYASLFYRLALELDVDARLIAGTSGGPHGWNIVELDEQYYNLDSTWDAALHREGAEYEYFLKCEENFFNHWRYDEYTTEEFYREYPMSATDYRHNASTKPEPKPEPEPEPELPVPDKISNVCGPDLIWLLNEDGTLRIQGSGEMTSAPWKGMAIQRVEFSPQVTTICDGAFEDCDTLRSVAWPDSLCSIGRNAFSGCDNLFFVKLPKQVTGIGAGAFSYCSALSRVELSEGVQVIADGAFEGCTALMDIPLPESVVLIGTAVFAGCCSLTEMTLPDGVYVVSDHLFDGCTSLSEVTIPMGVQMIGEGAFSGCTVMKDVFYGGTVTQWKQISVGQDNVPLFVAQLHCVRQLSGWVPSGGRWRYYDADGEMVTDKWIRDSVGWCYLGSDGYCVTDKWIRDSVGWCYLGSDGRAVTNKWVRDSKNWCYLGSDGRMLTNRWVRDSVSWCYVGRDGYCVTDKWMRDSKGWCYLDSDGRMVTNRWVQDSHGWCYIGADGHMIATA